jgi:hypothetical protein
MEGDGGGKAAGLTVLASAMLCEAEKHKKPKEFDAGVDLLNTLGTTRIPCEVLRLIAKVLPKMVQE